MRVHPDKGNWTYQYNALGELIQQTDANGQTQQLYYDAMRRLWKRTENRASGGSFIAEQTVTFIYDTANLGATSNKAFGLIATDSSSMGDFTRSYLYDSFGRGVGVVSDLAAVRAAIGSELFSSVAFGREDIFRFKFLY